MFFKRAIDSNARDKKFWGIDIDFYLRRLPNIISYQIQIRNVQIRSNIVVAKSVACDLYVL